MILFALQNSFKVIPVFMNEMKKPCDLVAGYENSCRQTRRLEAQGMDASLSGMHLKEPGDSGERLLYI